MTDLNQAAEHWLSKGDTFRSIIRIRRDRPKTSVRQDVDTPQALIAFFTMLREERERISYGLYHMICVDLGIASPKMQARTFGALVMRHLPNEFRHFVCRKGQSHLGRSAGHDGWYSDIASAHFVSRWASEVDDNPPHETIDVWLDFKEDLAFTTDFIRAYDAMKAKEEDEVEEVETVEVKVQTRLQRLWAWIRRK